MITIKHIAGYSFRINFDKADIAVIRRLADTYGIPFDDMIIGCINKGIYVIGEGITKKADPRVPDSDEPEQS